MPICRIEQTVPFVLPKRETDVLYCGFTRDENSFDLYLCKTNSKKSLKSGGTIIASGVSHDFRISPDGSHLLYSEVNSDKSSLCSYNKVRARLRRLHQGQKKSYLHMTLRLFI
jgi:Tol biopolymer transport system component